MDHLKKYKILALIGLIVSLLLSFAIFAGTRNLLITIDPESKFSWIYIFVVIDFIVLLIFYTIILQLTRIKEDETKYLAKPEIIESLNKKEKGQETGKKEEESIDTEYYISKVIPKKTSKDTLISYTEKVLSNIAREFDIVQGLFYMREKGADEFAIAGKYAYFGEQEPPNFEIGVTIPGQVAKNQIIMNLDSIPDNYLTILSGLGSSSPENMLIVPVILEDKTIGIIELASFKAFSKKDEKIFEAIASSLVKEIQSLTT